MKFARKDTRFWTLVTGHRLLPAGIWPEVTGCLVLGIKRYKVEGCKVKGIGARLTAHGTGRTVQG